MKRKILLTLIIVIVLPAAAIAFCWRGIPHGQAQMRRGLETLVTILETRFDRPTITDWSSVTGLVVLGGEPSRLKEAFELAGAHAHLRIVVSGPSDYELGLIAQAGPSVAERIVLETKSLALQKDTYGNAVYCTELIQPGPGERWLLVTSAPHMPRAIGTFRKAGFMIEPWPVAKRTGQFEALVATAKHEWLGLIAYRLLGRTSALLPAAEPGGFRGL